MEKKAICLKKGERTLTFEYRGATELLHPNVIEKEVTVEDLTRSFQNVISSKPLEELLKTPERITIVISDITRKTSSSKIIEALLKEIGSTRKAKPAIRIVIANGTHRKLTADEISSLTGDAARGRNIEILQNDARDGKSFVSYGITSFGTPVEVNRIVLDTDLLILTGSIGFHYHAGFTGGRKSIIPGIASQSTALSNHRLYFKSLEKEKAVTSMTGILDNNPVHQDMIEAVGMTQTEPFLINTSPGGTVPLFTGHWLKAHVSGCHETLRRYSIPLKKRRSLVFASPGGYPFDINMIQTHKAIEHARNALEPGGVLIVAAECQDGYGHPDFFPWFSYGTSEEISKNLSKDFQIYGQTAFSLKSKAERYKIILLSALPREEVEMMGLIPASDPGEAIEKALRILGKEVSAFVIPQGSKALPLLG